VANREALTLATIKAMISTHDDRRMMIAIAELRGGATFVVNERDSAVAG